MKILLSILLLSSFATESTRIINRTNEDLTIIEQHPKLLQFPMLPRILRPNGSVEFCHKSTKVEVRSSDGSIVTTFDNDRRDVEIKITVDPVSRFFVMTRRLI